MAMSRWVKAAVLGRGLRRALSAIPVQPSGLVKYSQWVRQAYA